MPTAAATGKKSVAPSVVTTATWEMGPVRQISRSSLICREPIPKKIRTAARVGTATSPTATGGPPSPEPPG
jgi:hypothetical protein